MTRNGSARGLPGTNDPLKVALLLDAFLLGGTERQFCRLAVALAADGHSVQILSLASPGPGTAEMESELTGAGVGIFYGTRGSRGVGQVVGLHRLMSRWVRMVDPDVLHAGMSRSMAVAGMLAGRPSWPPTVLSRRSLVSARRDHPATVALRRWTMGRSQAVVANADVVAKDASIHDRVPIERYRVIPNILADSAFAAVPKITITTDLPIVVSVANLREPKGHAHLLDALTRLKSQGIPFSAILVGEGDLRAHIEMAAARQQLDVRIVGSVNDVRPYLRASDVFVQSSLEEGMSNSLLEAMAAGCPIVATDVGGTKQALGDCGVLVNPGDSAALGHALRDLINDPPTARMLGMRAKDRARDFTAQASASSHVSLYREVIAASRVD